MERGTARPSWILSMAWRLTVSIGLVLSSCPGWIVALDCNGNGVDDDVARGEAADCNGNASPDECDVPPLDFRSFTALEVGGVARMLEAMDLDGDGSADLVVGHNEGLSILHGGDEAETFDTIEVELESRVLAWRFGDLDGDGETDFVARQESILKVLWEPSTIARSTAPSPSNSPTVSDQNRPPGTDSTVPSSTRGSIRFP